MLGLAHFKTAAAVLAITLGLSDAALANDFTVSPTSIRVAQGQQVATLTVTSGGPGATFGQVRVMRWFRDGGQGKLTSTRDVVASPPALRMAPNQELTIRLVRTLKSEVRAEECYRVLVDQLPGKSQQGQVIKFTVRHSVPVCFGPPS
ncbi:fimbrial biogenesis chaperone [Pseudorhodobacter ferrugineus]|uniref:fimbrial biogenesis chaperone n=1 Tax=Pseudorhodobacter ferrugineus TaxID=77008 RepID=UPI00067E5B44|nr:fimbria/pilus periplasmic chaperone [Pseudorhodobacter ferrugineus]